MLKMTTPWGCTEEVEPYQHGVACGVECTHAVVAAQVTEDIIGHAVTVIHSHSVEGTVIASMSF